MLMSVGIKNTSVTSTVKISLARISVAALVASF